jgi:hypothetical protein
MAAMNKTYNQGHMAFQAIRSKQVAFRICGLLSGYLMKTECVEMPCSNQKNQRLPGYQGQQDKSLITQQH